MQLISKSKSRGLKEEDREYTLVNFEYKILKYEDFIKSKYKLILEAKETHDDNIIKHILNNLLLDKLNFYNYFCLEKI